MPESTCCSPATPRPVANLCGGWAPGADVAVYEATCNEENGEVCRKYGHSTTLEAVSEGDAMGVKELVLTHIDERFNPTIYQDVKKMRRQVVVAEDNMVVRL